MILQKISTTILLVTALNISLVACNRSDAAKNAPAGDGTPATTESPVPARDQQRLALRSKIKAVLTPAQVQQFETKINAGGKMREALAGINLTDTQKSKIKEIYQASRAERQKSSGEGAQ
jgi:Spy/CpxP family protein refolding chaperone